MVSGDVILHGKHFPFHIKQQPKPSFPIFFFPLSLMTLHYLPLLISLIPTLQTPILHPLHTFPTMILIPILHTPILHPLHTFPTIIVHHHLLSLALHPTQLMLHMSLGDQQEYLKNPIIFLTMFVVILFGVLLFLSLIYLMNFKLCYLVNHSRRNLVHTMKLLKILSGKMLCTKNLKLLLKIIHGRYFLYPWKKGHWLKMGLQNQATSRCIIRTIQSQIDRERL